MTATVDGFNVVGDYYRQHRKRRDGYVIYDHDDAGTGVILLDPQFIR